MNNKHYPILITFTGPQKRLKAKVVAWFWNLLLSPFVTFRVGKQVNPELVKGQ